MCIPFIPFMSGRIYRGYAVSIIPLIIGLAHRPSGQEELYSKGYTWGTGKSHWTWMGFIQQDLELWFIWQDAVMRWVFWGPFGHRECLCMFERYGSLRWLGFKMALNISRPCKHVLVWSLPTFSQGWSAWPTEYGKHASLTSWFLWLSWKPDTMHKDTQSLRDPHGKQLIYHH